MTPKVTRRRFLTLAASATTLGLGAPTSASASCEGVAPEPSCPLPEPASAPFDTVVVLMMENRSFDHLLGWLPGANGKQEGLTYKDPQGQDTRPGRLAPISRAVYTATQTTPGKASRCSMPTGRATAS